MAKTITQLEEENKASLQRITSLEKTNGEQAAKIEMLTGEKKMHLDRIASLEEANKGLAASNSHLDGLVKAAASAQRPETMRHRIGADNLPPGVTEEQIRDKIKESGQQLKREEAIRILTHHAAIEEAEAK